MRTLATAAPLLLLLIAAAAKSPNEKQDLQRKPEPDVRRVESHFFETVPTGPYWLQGTLVDAGCPDRSMLNLRQPPETTRTGTSGGMQNADRVAASEAGGVAAHGISVDSQTLSRERADVMEHRVQDLAGRQMDPTCAVTSGSRAFSLLLDNGRLLDFEDAGNVQAIEAINANEAGRAMLNGAGPGIKPRIAVEGLVKGDRLMVAQLKVL
ncbi:MAG TPA: hypothetical protein VGF59_01515 [Bryobacteraceae bacterium]